MQEPYPRAQSVMQIRSSSFSNKASRIFNKVSNFKGRLRLGSTRKSQDDKGASAGPYMNSSRETRSMDLDMHVAKPYMSQPMLTMPNMLEDHDGADSSSSQSMSTPQHSPTRANFSLAQSLTKNTRSPFASTAKTPTASSRSGAVEGLPNTVAASSVMPSPSQSSGLPSPSSSSGDAQINRRYQAQLDNSPASSPSPLRASAAPRTKRTKAKSDAPQPTSSLSSKPSPPLPTSSSPLIKAKVNDAASIRSAYTSSENAIRPEAVGFSTKRPTTSGSTMSTSSTATVTPVSIQRNVHYPENRPRSEAETSLNHPVTRSPNFSHPFTAQNTSQSSTSATKTRITDLPQSASPKPVFSHPIALPPPSQAPPQSSSLPISIPRSTATPVSLAKRPLTSPTSPTASTPTSPISASFPSRRPSAPRLTTPLPGHRFSLIMSDTESATARLSPSIVIRQPAFPLPRLPTLKLPESESSGSGGASPVLNQNHRLSASEGAGPSNLRHGSLNSPVSRAQSKRHLREMPALPMAGTEPPRDDDDDNDSEGESDEDDEDTDVEAEDDEDDGPARSSFDSRGTTSFEVPTRSPAPSLPNVDLSRIDLSFLNYPPSATDTHSHAKGKERARDETSTRTPTQTPGLTSARTPRFSGTSNHNDYFSVQFGNGGTPRVPPSTPSVGTAARTPKAIELLVPKTPPIPIPGQPGLYKHASRSMVDISGLQVGRAHEGETGTGTWAMAVKKEMGDGEDGAVAGVSDGLLDNVDGIKKRNEASSFGGNEEASSAEGAATAAKVHNTSSAADTVAVLPPRADALMITEEPRDPTSMRKDTGPFSSQEEHMAHIQSPAPRPHPSRTPSARPLSSGSLLRRRSMPTFNVASPPPPYPSFVFEYSHQQPITHSADFLPPPPHHHLPPPVFPHEILEGDETLPPYSNDIHLRAIMPRKLEFTKPGVQAKDRKWRKVVCELEGTVFRVYRCPPGFAGTRKVVDWWERKVGVGDMSVGTGVGGAGGGGVSSAGGTATVGVSAGALQSAEEREREQERLRIEKIAGENGGQTTEIRLPRPPRSDASVSPEPEQGQGHVRDRSVSRTRGGDNPDTPPPPSRSRLANLLKPPKSHHGRTQSELMGNPKALQSASRSSLQIPRPSFGASSSSSASDSSSQSHSHSNHMPAAPSNSSRLSVSIPSSASTISSRGTLASAASSSAAQSMETTPTTSTAFSSNANVNATTTATRGILCPLPDKNDLIRAYTLQQAESGLGNDYLKRKNVIRVRMEGEQFLLQARDVTDVVDWIEGLHSATNIALDLDERPMPRGPLFPRRRRRRPRRTNTETGENATSSTGITVS